MERVEKTVFISYRHTNFPWALSVYQDLTNHGFDVFIDYQGIGSGDFESVILGNIKARAHFLILLTPSALERCGEPGDLLRREIETALDTKRNIVPLMLEGFSFGTPAIATQLTGSLAPLKDYNGLSMPAEYFLAAMDKLRGMFLNVPLTAVLHPVSASAKQVAAEQKAAADAAPVVQEEELKAQQEFEHEFAAMGREEKLGLYSEAIRLDPDFLFGLSHRGTLLWEKGDYEGAISDFNEVIRLCPDHARGYTLRGIARQAKKDWPGALADFNESVRLEPGDAKVRTLRDNARFASGDFQGAMVDYDEAIRLKPDLPLAFLNRGVAHLFKGDIVSAIADFNETIRLNPEDADAFYWRGEASAMQEQPAAAIADFRQFLKLQGGDPDRKIALAEQMIADLTKKL
jgi:tetratricopeptide (TPR) repeat protein